MTTQTEWIRWLRILATKGSTNDAGMVDNIDARALGRLADELERLYAIERTITPEQQ